MSCRVESPPIRACVVANVPASLLHGTVMPLTGEPILFPQVVGHSPRGQETPYFRCKESEAHRGPATIRERCEPGHWGKASLPDISEI